MRRSHLTTKERQCTCNSELSSPFVMTALVNRDEKPTMKHLIFTNTKSETCFCKLQLLTVLFNFINFSIILLTFTLRLIPSPEAKGRNWILLADSSDRAIYCMAIVTSKGAF